MSGMKACLLIMLLAGPIQGQTSARKVVLSGEEPQAALRLQAVDRLVDPFGSAEMIARNVGLLGGLMPLWHATTASATFCNMPQRWEQVLGEYERLIQEDDDGLVPGLDRDRLTPSVQGRNVGHRRLAEVPPALLVSYRARVDSQAKKLFDDGRANRDPAALRRLVDEMFCSRWGEDALLLLGDLAFERGQFDEARWWWRCVVPTLTGEPEGLTFPDPRSDPAGVRARQILALVFAGQAAEARRELAAYRLRHGRAEGTLGGQKGNLAEILEGVASRVRGQAFFQEDGWMTFGGSPARQRVVSQPINSRLWVDGPTWRVTLPGKPQVPRQGLYPQPAFHPLIVGDQVILADARTVYAYHLVTGRLLWDYDLKKAGHEVPEPGDGKSDYPAHFTLSADGRRVYVRLGQQVLEAQRTAGTSLIVCLDAEPELGARPRELWHVSTQAALFEGSPLVVEDRLYVAQTRGKGLRTQTSLLCLDAATGKQRWKQVVCENPEFEEGGQGRGLHHLVTFAGGQLVYCSHAGAVVAVDPWTGQRLWGLRYPSRGQSTASGAPSPRSLAPCVYHQDRLYVAPLDTDHLFCLDPASGAVVWERANIEVVQLLGVSDERLFFTTVHGLRAVNATSGNDQGGWLQPTIGRLPALGRGLLAGGWLFWPTQDKLFPYRAVTQSEGSQESEAAPFYEPTMLRGLVPGNMAFARDCLVIAGQRDLVAYVSPQRRAEKVVGSAADVYRRALARAAVGQSAQSATDFVQLAGHGDAWKGLAEERLEQLLRDDPAAAKTWPGEALAAVRRRREQRRIVADAVEKRPSPAPRKAEPARQGPLLRQWEAAGEQLFPGEQGGLDDVVLTRTGSKVHCRRVDSGDLHWSCEVPFEATWAGGGANVVVFAGPQGVQACRREDGKLLWRLAQSPRYVVGGDRPMAAIDSGGLDQFHLVGEKLYFQQDQGRLWAVDVATGRVSWQLWAPGGPIRPLEDGGRFAGKLLCSARWILVQTNQGKCWHVDSDRGEVAAETSVRTWERSPAVVGANRAIGGESGGVVSMIEINSGRVVWQHTPHWSHSLTGAAAQVLVQGDVVVALIPMNYGHELTRLDLATGKPLWPHATLLRAEVDLPRACVGAAGIFMVENNRLQCRTLTSGKLQWERALPERARHWQTRLLGEMVAVYPADEPVLPMLPVYPDPWGFTFGRLLTPTARGEFVVWLFDAQSGAPVQRLAATTGFGRVVLQNGTLIVDAGGAVMGYSR